MELVILHGLGQDSNSWNEVKEELENINPIIPNLFKIKDKISYDNVYKNLEKILEDKVEIILCGLSLGGVLALNYAYNHPDKLRKLILIGIPYIIPQELIDKQNDMFNQMPGEAFNGLGLNKADFINLVNTTFDVDIPKWVKGISCKTIVACGDNDIANLDSCKIVNRKIEESKFVLINNSGHMVNSDKPKETALLIKDNI